MTQDNSIQFLFDYFQNWIPLNEEEKELLQQKLRIRHYRRRQYILQEEDICKHYHFVVKGCLRMYKINHQGNTHIIKFASENNWITDTNSFYNIEPSLLNIDALEDTTVLQITRDELISLYLKAPKFDRIFRILTENELARLQQRHLHALSVTAEEHYKAFVKIYPHLVNRLPQVQVAAFLGITPEFLSRLRSRQSKNPLAKS